ncbi:MAG: ATP-binding protein [Lysobacteraceae bacterium]
MPDTDPQSAADGIPSRAPDLDGLPDALSDALLVLDERGLPTYANPAAARMLEALGVDIPGERVAAWLLGQVPAMALERAREAGAWQGITHVDVGDGADITLRVNVFKRDADLARSARPPVYFVLMRDITESVRRERELQRRHSELQLAYARLQGSQDQLLQSEKMASIGQLAAGVAHEINNPIGYVHSNLGTLQEYLRNLIRLLEAYDEALRNSALPPEVKQELVELRVRYDLDFVSQDLPDLLEESREGIDRVCKIVRDLKEFSHAGRDESWTRVDLHRGLDSTLNIVWNELKYKARVRKEYGQLPPVECLPSEINQVFMNLLINAGQAIREQGEITLRSGCDEREVWVSVSDTGVGIPEDELGKIFDPFYTSKPVGQGTGLGLSISYGIVAKHNGRIEVDSRPGEGTTFTVVLPVKQPLSAGAAAGPRTS